MAKIKDMFRMAEWLFVAALLAIAIYFVAPQQLPVVAYKALLVTFFGFLGYWLDRRLFRYGRCGKSLDATVEGWCQIRRAIVVAAVVIAGALAL